MIHFPGRRELVREAQQILGIPADGIDGPQTWRSLILATAGQKAADTILPPRTGPLSTFVGRTQAVRAVQHAIGVTVDGADGPQTWSGIMQRLRPLPPTPAIPPAGGSFPETIRGRSPNRNAGQNERLGIVLHHAAGTFEGTIDWCLRAGTNAAYHCLIAPDGRRATLGEDFDRLHHAGKSVWRGRSGCNAFMLGLAFTGDTNTGIHRPQKDLLQAEILSAVEWIRSKMALHNIPVSEITHHRVVSPGRKDDLSPAAWAQMQRALFGK